MTHHKVIGPANWGKSVETLRLVDEARATRRGRHDRSISIHGVEHGIQAALLPAWAREGGREQMLAPPQRPGDAREDQGRSRPAHPERAGRRRSEECRPRALRLGRLAGREEPRRRHAPARAWSRRSTTPPRRRCGSSSRAAVRAIFHAIGEEDLERILRHPATMIASDGEVPIFGNDSPHPRSYGTFARVLAVYVRERNTITLEDAVRKMTAFPAQRLGLADRGVLRPGMKADVAVFDPARVRDRATFEKPHQYAEGFLVRHRERSGCVRGRRDDVGPAGKVLYGPAVNKADASK